MRGVGDSRAGRRRFWLAALTLSLCTAPPLWSGPSSSPRPRQAAPAPGAQPAGLAPGDVVPEFEAEGLDGKTTRIGYPKGKSTVLLFFLSGCPTCHKMIPLWNEAFERQGGHVNVVGVLMDQEPPGFFMAMPISFPVVRSPGREFLRTYKITNAPTTVRVASGGKVEDVGRGVLDSIRLGQFFRP